jgi:Toprim domain-containing protein
VAQRCHLELYGRENLNDKPAQIIICEGEFDRLVLEANGFKAVTSTGGAKAFKKEWAKEFANISGVYLCFDNDEAGKSGALRVGGFIPHAKIVELPNDVGEGGDVIGQERTSLPPKGPQLDRLSVKKTAVPLFHRFTS